MSEKNHGKINKKNCKPNPNDQSSFETKLSIIKLFASKNIISLLIIFAGMVIVEVGAFAIFGISGGPEFIEAAVFAVRIPIYITMAISYVLTCYVLTNTLTGKAGKPIYTIQRLRVNEKDIFVLNCIYNALVFVTYLGFQVLAALLMILIFKLSGCGVEGPQNIMMAFYRTTFFHSVMPMGNWIILIRNAFYAWSLGVLTALKSQRSREGGTVYGLYFCAALILISFIYNPMNVYVMAIRVQEIVTYCIAAPFTITAFLAGKAHREHQWEEDEFEASIAEYRLEDE
ncbi:MAG: hypothetical protein Q4E99_01045 [Bacillota bacterium]|nr:hypothetical protein [Bacillota bacterium]